MSPAEMALGFVPAATLTAVCKVASPLPIRIDTSLDPLLATARSALPSRLKSADTTATGVVCAPNVVTALIVPAPVAGTIATVLGPPLLGGRSRRLYRMDTGVATGHVATQVQ